MKLAVIGNSHAACLKIAWDRIASEYPDVSIVFFASGGGSIRELRREGHKLVPANDDLRKNLLHTSGGLGSVDLMAYDALLFVGLASRPIILDEAQSRTPQMVKDLLDKATKGKNDGFRIYFRLVQEVSGVFQGPVFVAHTPLPAMRDRKTAAQDVGGYFKGLDLLNGQVLEPLGAKMCSQPRETVVNGRNTAHIYSTGSKRLVASARSANAAHSDEDNRHMNDVFGELWLRKFFKEDLPAGAVAKA